MTQPSTEVSLAVIVLLLSLDGLAAHVLPLRFAPTKQPGPGGDDVLTSPKIEELLRLAESEARGMRTMARGLEQLLGVGGSSRVDSFTMSRVCEPAELRFKDFPCVRELLLDPCMASGSTPTGAADVQRLLDRQQRYMRDATKGLRVLEDVSTTFCVRSMLACARVTFCCRVWPVECDRLITLRNSIDFARNAR